MPAGSSWNGSVVCQVPRIRARCSSLGDTTVTARFAPIQQYSLTTAVVGQGTISSAPTGVTHEAGTAVTLTAVAATGWRFDRWTGDATGTGISTSVVMDADRSVTATFVEDVPLALSVSSVGQGTTAVDPVAPSYRSGDTITVRAEPAAGWQFAGWTSDPVISANWHASDRQYRIPIEADPGDHARTEALVEQSIDLSAALSDSGR
jgi:uncharacterized repeat protein (TIGR02543 family)